jgi:4'-phosphopantetheinyl transferase
MLPIPTPIQSPLEAELAWRTTSIPPVLEGNAIHIWRGDEGMSPQQLEDLRKTLSCDELSRAASFRFDRDRRRFILCRGILRGLLGQYLDEKPGDIRFSYGPCGKPMLEGNPIHFNLSHTLGMWLIALSAHESLGIDVEKIRPQPNLLEMARRFLRPQEWNAIAHAVAADRAKIFFTCWACKEACLKAQGLGIDETTAVWDSALTAAQSHRWLRLLNVGPSFASAICASTAPTDLQLLLLSESSVVSGNVYDQPPPCVCNLR